MNNASVTPALVTILLNTQIKVKKNAWVGLKVLEALDGFPGVPASVGSRCGGGGFLGLYGGFELHLLGN